MGHHVVGRPALAHHGRTFIYVEEDPDRNSHGMPPGGFASTTCVGDTQLGSNAATIWPMATMAIQNLATPSRSFKVYGPQKYQVAAAAYLIGLDGEL